MTTFYAFGIPAPQLAYETRDDFYSLGDWRADSTPFYIQRMARSPEEAVAVMRAHLDELAGDYGFCYVATPGNVIGAGQEYRLRDIRAAILDYGDWYLAVALVQPLFWQTQQEVYAP